MLNVMTAESGTSAKRWRQSSKPQTPVSAFGNRRSLRHSNVQNPVFTPRIDRLTFRLQSNHSDDEDELTENFEEILDSTWTLYRVSPLHEFSYHEIHLKQYGLRLKEYLTSLTTDFENAKVQYMTKFSTVKGLTQTKYDYDAVKVEVKCSQDGKTNKSSYLGLLISRGATQSLTSKKFVNLPVLLCKGPIGTSTSVHKVLQKFFDCSIQQLKLTQEDLIWLNGILLSLCSRHRASTEVQYTYIIPHCLKNNNIVLSIPASMLIDTWLSIHNSNFNDILYEEVKALHEGIEEHFYKILGVNVGHCQLVKLKLPNITISSEGKFKVKQQDVADNVLTFLYSVATLLEKSTPPLGHKLK